MKTSTKVLGSVLLIIIAAISVGIIGSRIYLNTLMGSEYKDRANIILESNETITFDLNGFNNIEFVGAWNIEINQGTAYKVEVEGPGNLLGEIEFNQKGNNLTARNNYKGGFGKETFTIRMTLPKLEGIIIAGGADLTFDGFTGETLSVTLAGAGRIRAYDSEYKQLNVICAGAGQLDFSDLKSRDADINLSGAGEVLVNMDGGELSGSISGMGSVKYEGRVSNESMRVSGLGEVSQR
jgi:Putative auto-transporter adhesin, head GIN domain